MASAALSLPPERLRTCRTVLLIADSMLTDELPGDLGDCCHTKAAIASQHGSHSFGNLINCIALFFFDVNDFLCFGTVFLCKRDAKGFGPVAGTVLLERNALQVAKLLHLGSHLAIERIFIDVTPATWRLKRDQAT